MDRARAIFLANERERKERKAASKLAKETGAATPQPAFRITRRHIRAAQARAHALDMSLPPRDRE